MRAFVFLLILTLLSCESHQGAERTDLRQTKVGLVSFGSRADSLLPFLASEIEAFYGCKVVLLPQSSLPRQAYYHPRKRYRADSLISYLKIYANDSIKVVAGLTDVDISASVGKHQDWGVFGLGFCPGPSCIISTFRLDNDNPAEAQLKTRIKNVFLHELGHNFGLPHCEYNDCLMKDAKGKLSSVVGEGMTLCQECHNRLYGK